MRRPGRPTASIATLTTRSWRRWPTRTSAQRFAELGTAPVPPEDATPQALQAKLRAEIDRWRPVIEAAGEFAE